MDPKIISNFYNLTIEPTFKTLLLDFDNTCYEYEPCHQAGLKIVHSAIEDITGPLPDFIEQYTVAQKRVKKRIPTHASSHSRILYFLALFEQLGRRDGHQYVVDLEARYWQTFMSTMQITPGLREFLSGCHKNDITIVVVSDLTTTIQCEKIKKLGIVDKIDYLVTTEEAGADKPNPSSFKLAIEKSGGDIQTTLMIGDDYEKDIIGAQALGISSILFRHDKKTHRPSL